VSTNEVEISLDGQVELKLAQNLAASS